MQISYFPDVQIFFLLMDIKENNSIEMNLYGELRSGGILDDRATSNEKQSPLGLPIYRFFQPKAISFKGQALNNRHILNTYHVLSTVLELDFSFKFINLELLVLLY